MASQIFPLIPGVFLAISIYLAYERSIGVFISFCFLSFFVIFCPLSPFLLVFPLSICILEGRANFPKCWPIRLSAGGPWLCFESLFPTIVRLRQFNQWKSLPDYLRSHNPDWKVAVNREIIGGWLAESLSLAKPKVEYRISGVLHMPEPCFLDRTRQIVQVPKQSSLRIADKMPWFDTSSSTRKM